ncbi:MAG: hypothetical protein M3015_11050 [Bacteroidota bacterium]|nr:hypothetical protein [Bacteroidota bacterium]
MTNDNVIVEDKPTGLEDLFTKLKDYAETKIDLVKLMGINRVSGFMSTVISMIILLMILFTTILCISIGLAILIGQLLGATYYGFFIIAGLYLLIGLVLYARRGSILKEPVSNRLIKEMMD